MKKQMPLTQTLWHVSLLTTPNLPNLPNLFNLPNLPNLFNLFNLFNLPNLFTLFNLPNLFILLNLFNLLPAFSQPLPLKPPIRNYTPKEYAAHPQVWCAVSDHRGVLYFGAGQDVLEYDGKTWRLIPVKQGATVLSLATDSTGRIYVGAEGDFGYLSQQSLVVSSKLLVVSNKAQKEELDSLKVAEDTLPKGTLRYVSLLHLVPEKERNFGDVWKTHTCRQGTFFNAYTHLFYYDGKKIRVIKPEELMGADTAGTKPQNRRFLRSFLIDDTLYIEHRAMGILAYLEKEWSPPLAGSKEFVTGTKGICSLLPASKQKSEFFVVTRADGFWHYNASAKPEFTQFISGTQSGVQRGGKIVSSNWDMYEPQCQPYGAILLKTIGDDTIADVSIAIITNYNGCYIFSPLIKNDGTGNSLGLQHHFNRESGTLDNMIWNILSTDNERWSQNTSLLWLCNNNGISKVTYPSPLSYYGYKEGIEGSIQSIITWKNRIWLSTAQGVYYSLDPEIPQERIKTDKGLYFERLPGIDAECWNILSYRKAGAVKGEKEEVLIIATTLELYEVSVFTGGEIKAKQICKANSYGLTAEDIRGGRIFSGADGLYTTWQTEAGWTTTTLLTEKEVKGINSITLSENKTTLSEKGEEETELWLGTFYQGLLRIVVTADNKVKETEWYREEDGLPEGLINTFSCTGAAGSNGVLVGTDKGLFEVVSRKLKVVSGEKEVGSRESEDGSRETGDGSQEYAQNGADGQLNSSETQIKNQKSKITNHKSPIKNYKLLPCTRYGEMFAGKLKSDSGSYRQVFLFVEEENGDVWINAPHGEMKRIDHLLLQKDKSYKIDSIPFLNLKDKIGEIYAIHPSGDGITYFGGTEGLAMYDTKVNKNYKPVYSTLVRKVMVGEDSVVFNGAEEKVGSRQMAVGSVETPEGSQATAMVQIFAADINNIKFEYAAPFFEEEEKTEYSYKLEGFDKDWSKWSTDAKTKYTNLEPGEYSFLVKAKNIYKHESEVGEYVFEIEPPFYRTWWFSASEWFFFILLTVAVFVVKKRSTRYGIALSRFTTTSGMFVGFEYMQYFAEAMLGAKLTLLVIAKVGMSAVFGIMQRPLERLYFGMVGLLREKEKTEKKSLIGSTLEKMSKVGVKGDIMQAEIRGKREYQKEVVKRMVGKSFGVDIILECTGLTQGEYERMVVA